MIQSYAFRNRDGLLGIFQKEDDIVHLYVDSQFYTYECRNWKEWTQQAESDYDQRFAGGDTSKPTEKINYYYLLRFCEGINIDVLDLVESRRSRIFLFAYQQRKFSIQLRGR